jgi:predicted negative regulator of RcsB-dependent stress response
MQWTDLTPAFAMIVAAIALLQSIRLRAQCSQLSAAIASLRGSMSEMEQTERLTASQLAELAAVRDAVDKGNALLKRIASREAMRDRRDSSAPMPVDPAALKDHLRRKAGLVAGRPANHSEN